MKRQIIATLLRADRPDLANAIAKTVTANKPKPLYRLGSFMSEWIGYVRERLAKQPGGDIWYKREQTGRDPLYRKVKTGKRTHSWRRAETRVYEGQTYVLLDMEGWHWTAWRKQPTTAGRKLENRIRQKANQDLIKAGLDGNGRFRRIGEALNAIAKVLERHGIQQDEVFSANLFRDDKGHRTFEVAYQNPDDPFSPETIDNALLVIQWYRLDNDAYEVVSYLS